MLLKPQSDRQAQIVVNGIVQGTYEAHAFFGSERLKLLPNILQSFNELRAEFDLVLVEGAGSPAETNLRNGDLANMGFAQAADIPVSLIADIERGGSIASLVGTQAVLDESDNELRVSLSTSFAAIRRCLMMDLRISSTAPVGPATA